MRKILVLVPIKPNLTDKLRKQCYSLLHSMKTVCGNEVEIRTDEGGDGDSHIRNVTERGHHNAGVRNAMIDVHFDESLYDFVMWIDADIINYSPALPVILAKKALKIADNKLPPIMAPFVNYEGEPKRLYDTASFVTQRKQHASWFAPYWPDIDHDRHRSENVPIPLLGVGCVYLVPSYIYGMGVRHEGHPVFVEHYNVCQASKSGCYVDMTHTATHACLPNWGEEIHL